MSKSPNSLRAAVGGLPKITAADRENATEIDLRDGVRRQTFYLPAAVHDQFRELAHTKRCSQNELFRRAADLLFAQEGFPSWKELTGK